MSDPQYENIGDPIVKTIEECTELIQILCKVQRFGWKSHDPYDPEKIPNYDLVRGEIADVKKRVGELEREIERVVGEE